MKRNSVEASLTKCMCEVKSQQDRLLGSIRDSLFKSGAETMAVGGSTVHTVLLQPLQNQGE